MTSCENVCTCMGAKCALILFWWPYFQQNDRTRCRTGQKYLLRSSNKSVPGLAIDHINVYPICDYMGMCQASYEITIWLAQPSVISRYLGSMGFDSQPYGIWLIWCIVIHHVMINVVMICFRDEHWKCWWYWLFSGIQGTMKVYHHHIQERMISQYIN